MIAELGVGDELQVGPGIVEIERERDSKASLVVAATFVLFPKGRTTCSLLTLQFDDVFVRRNWRVVVASRRC